MSVRTTILRGLTFDILIEEVHEVGADGRLICYVASIYLQDRGSEIKRLVRKSRLPGAAENLRGEVKRKGVRVFDRFKDL